MQTHSKALVLLFLAACSSEKVADSSEIEQPQVQPEQEDTNTDTNADTSTDSATETAEPITEYNIWSGPTVIFTKPDDADFMDPVYQDSITDKVVLTRGERGSLFNVPLESSADSSSPQGTEWAQGTTDSIATLEFKSLKEASNQSMQNLSGKVFVLHLIEDDIYLDVKFLQWSSSNSGGGFSYERSTEN